MIGLENIQIFLELRAAVLPRPGRRSGAGRLDRSHTSQLPKPSSLSDLQRGILIGVDLKVKTRTKNKEDAKQFRK